ncbi:MAG: TolC family protein [Prevotellaceae bacterium]|nr:TolC family protein [Prevotellaceae bacterium]
MFLFSLCRPTPALAAAGEELSLQECIDMALRQNRQVQMAAMQTQGARYQSKSLRANFFPSFSAEGTALYSNANGSLAIAGGNLPTFLASGVVDGGFAYFPGTDIDFKVGAVYMAGLQLQQPIYTGGKIRAAYAMSTLGVQMARLNERLTASEVLVETVKAYAGVVKAREMVEVARKYDEMLSGLMKDVESAYSHGLSQKNDVLKVQVQKNGSELSMRRAENALRLATMSLCHLIGKPLTTQISVQSLFPEAGSLPETGQGDITARPEFDMLERQVQVAGWEVRMSHSEKLPQVGVSGNYSYMHGLEVNDKSLFSKASFAVLLNVSIPLYHFGERTNNEAAAKAKLEQVQLRQADVSEQMLLELTQAENNLDEAELETRLAARSLEQAAENMRVSRSQYEAGMETLSDCLQAGALWQQAWQTHVEAQCDRYLSYVQYLKTSGQLSLLSHAIDTELP